MLSALLLTACVVEPSSPHGAAPHGVSLLAAPAEPAPDPALIDKCFKDLKNNPAFNCVSNLVGAMVPTQMQMEGCGCTFVGIGNDTKQVGRKIYFCPGQPAFFVSPVLVNGNLGIIATDGPNYPECMFDLTKLDGGAGPLVPGTDNCMSSGCHEDPKNPLFPLPTWDEDGGWKVPDLVSVPLDMKKDSGVDAAPKDMAAVVKDATVTAPTTTPVVAAPHPLGQ